MYGGHRWYSPFFQYWRIIDCTNVEEVIPPFNAAIPLIFPWKNAQALAWQAEKIL
jgi:hypothetical protein